ncbi:MAG: pilus assembly protein [Rhodobacteraceae bacterium]|nr:pilus assembly protein [Paracoccaceae bacterium]
MTKCCKYCKKIRKRLTSFRKRTEGTATVEAVLWLPVFIFLFGLLADTALLFGSQSRVLRVVQDANRAMSIGRFTKADDTMAYIKDQIAGLSPNAIVSTVVEDGIIYTQVSIPASDVTATGIVTAFADLQVNVFAEHLSEN